MTNETQSDLQERILAMWFATRDATKRGDLAAADSNWRECVGLLEFQMGRTGSSAHLTPDPNVQRAKEALP